MIKFTTVPFSGGELTRVSFDGVAADEEWAIAVRNYVASPRSPRQFFYIDNTQSLGMASHAGIKNAMSSLAGAAVTSLHVAYVSRNEGYDLIARMVEEIGESESLEVASRRFATREEAEAWLAGDNDKQAVDLPSA